MGRKKPNAPNAKRTLYVRMANAAITAKIVGGIDTAHMVVSRASARLAAGIPYVRMNAKNIGAPFAVRNVLMEKGWYTVESAIYYAF